MALSPRRPRKGLRRMDAPAAPAMQAAQVSEPRAALPPAPMPPQVSAPSVATEAVFSTFASVAQPAHADAPQAQTAPLMRDVSAASPRFAIVMPVFKHSVLVTEAIACALREAQASDGVVVIVNDGCPYPETHQVCQTFATAYPQWVSYLRTPNGGLSAARNRGIRQAMARYPGIEAVYLLDADNRLAPGAMRRALQTMATENADWVYPNIDKFGMEWSGDFSAPHSVLRHLFQNVCEAGSLIHRRVFDAGVFFDETMRQGYEDWEFWLQCADAGFRGAPCANFGFQYRARRESMVRNSDRDGAAILAYMHRKHKKLFSWKNILRLEHEEASRFCVIDPARQCYTLTSIPGKAARSGHLIDLDKLFWASDLYPTHTHFPHFVVVIDHRLQDELVRLKLVDTVFWQIEDALEAHPFVFITLETQDDAISFNVGGAESLAEIVRQGPHIVATRRQLLLECALDAHTSWIDSIQTPHPDMPVAALSFTAPVSPSVLNCFGTRHALQNLFHFFHQLRSSPMRRDQNPSWEWREAEALNPSAQLFTNVRDHMNAMGPLARCADTGENEIAFVVPIASFGGVEQVGIQVARQFKAAGWRTRLIVTERNEIKAPARLMDAFDALLFLNDDSYSGWQPSGLKYYGHELQQWPVQGRHDRLHGVVAGCGAVMMLQANHGYETMGWLKRQGIVTVTSLHLIDRDLLAAPVGHPYLTLAYEHAFDMITAPAHKLLDFCAASGVPQEKLFYMANAPTFEATPAMRSRRQYDLALSVTNPSRPLRILSMGRLDRQKGVERLWSLVHATQVEELEVEWRFVGGKVIEETEDTENSSTSIVVEPPIYDRTAVIERLLWADVVVLLSHWEGSPLLILEAQSVGAIPMATDVGAVSEMIEHGVDGILLANERMEHLVPKALAHLKELASHPERQQQMAQTAMERLESITWAVTSAQVVAKIQGLAQARG